MKKRIVSILLAVCMLVSFLPAGMLASAADGLTLDTDAVYLAVGASQTLTASGAVDTWESSNEEVASVIDGVIVANGAGTAQITATGADGSAIAYVAVTDEINFSYRFDKAYIGKTPSPSHTTQDWHPLSEVTYANTLAGHAEEYVSYSEIPTDPWAFNSLSSSWTSNITHAASASYGEKWGRGYSVWGYDSTTTYGPGSMSIRIKLPIDGNFIPSVTTFKGGGYGYVDYYLAPADAADPTAAQYFLGTVKLTGAGTPNNIDAFEALDLTAGEYIVTAKNDNTDTSTRLVLMIWTAFNLNNTDITKLEDDVVYLAPGKSQTLVATAPSKAADKTITFVSADDNIATVDADGVVTAQNVGTTTITATSTVGDSATAYVTVTDANEFYYSLDKTWKSSVATDWVDFETVTYGMTTKGHPDEVSSYPGTATAPWAFGSLEGWRYDGTISSLAKAYSVWSDGNPGNFAIKIKVPADGVYTPTATYTQGSGWGIGAYYMAPADAENPWAEEYYLGDASFSSSDKENHAGITSTFAERELTAGEYIVGVTHSAAGNMALMGWNAFTLKNESAVTVDFDGMIYAMQPGDAEVLAVNVLPEALDDKSVTYTSSNPDVAEVVDDMVLAAGEGTAVITATSNADPTKSDTIIVYVGDKVFKYDYMKFAGFGLTASDTTYYKNAANDYKYTTIGSPSEVGTAYKSFGWKVGALNSGVSRAWVWSTSAKSLGAYFIASTNGYESMNIYVPAAGTYTVSSIHSVWTGGGPIEMFIAPIDALDPFDTKYQLETKNHLSSTNVETEEVVGTLTVETPGEYIVIYRTTTGKGSFIKGLLLTDAEMTVDVESITLNKAGVNPLAIGDSLTATATVLPAGASDPSLSWTSSNDTVASVADGVVTAKAKGFATITATANDGSGCTASFDVMVGYGDAAAYYDLNTPANTLYLEASNKERDLDEGVLADSYAYSISQGSDPWMYDDSLMSTGKPYFNYTASSAGGFGVFAIYGGLGSWSRIKIKVAESGTYLGLLKLSDWAASHNFDVYIAPVLAADPVAAEYKVLSFVSEDPANRLTREDLTSEMALPSGDYYVTFVATSDLNDTLAAVHGLSMYKVGDIADADAVSITNSMVDGAAIRTRDPQGLRFTASIEKSGDYGKVIESGIILLPTVDLDGDNSNLVIGYENNNHKVAKVPAVNIYKDETDKATYTAVIINIKEANYTRAYSARAYAIYEDSNGNLSVVYSDTVTSRSIYEVAVNGLADESATDAEKAVFQAIVDAVNADA